MSTTTEIKFEFYIDSTSEQDTSNSLSPADATDLGLNAGVVVDQLGGGITFSNAGSIKGGKTDWDVGIGFWLGYQTDAYKVAIGDPANEKVTWDGDDLVIDIDASNLKINGSVGTQGIVVQSNGTVQFTSLVEELNDLSDVTGTTFSSTATKVLIPQSGNVYGFADLRSVTDSYIRLRDLSDVANTSPSDGHLLQYSSGSSLWTMVSTNGLIDFSDLGNKPTTLAGYGISDAYTNANVDAHLNLNTANTNDILMYNGSDYEWVNTGEVVWIPEQLNDLSDVTISSVADDHILQYNSSTSKFENVALSTAVGSVSFNKIQDADGDTKIQVEESSDEDTIRFDTAGSERIRILSTGGITFDGESTAAHALDDYEEGTWTPHFADAATGGNHVTAGTQPTGSYTKIGDIVHVSCPAQNINPSGLTSGNVLYIRNFPFTISSANLQTPCTSVNFTGRAASVMLGAYFFANPGGTHGFIILPSSSTGGENTQTVGQVLRTTTTGGAFTGIRFSITYKTA